MIRAVGTLADLGRGLVDFVYPPLCPLCRAPSLSTANGLCQDCARVLIPISGPSCPVCGRQFRAEGTGDHKCGSCITEPPRFDTALSWGIYEQSLALAIKRYKFHDALGLGGLLSGLLQETYDRQPAAHEPDLLIPVPLHKRRLRERGYNQSALLGRSLARRRKIYCEANQLKRIRFTRPQVGLTLNQRKKNVEGAFKLERSERVKGLKVVLVDDVITSGATVMECAKVLKRAGAEEVHVLALARAGD